jgi:hypothetical protein
MDSDQQPDVMTAGHEGEKLVASESLSETLRRHSDEMAETRRWLKAVAVIGTLALLGLVSIAIVKFDVVLAVIARLF